MSRDVGADRLVALAVRAYVNGPAIKERLSEPLENFAVPLAQDLEGSLATAAGSVRCEAGIEGRCSRDPHAVHQGKTRPVDEGKGSRPGSAPLSPKPRPDRRGRWVRSELRCRAAAPRRLPPRRDQIGLLEAGTSRPAPSPS